MGLRADDALRPCLVLDPVDCTDQLKGTVCRRLLDRGLKELSSHMCKAAAARTTLDTRDWIVASIRVDHQSTRGACEHVGRRVTRAIGAETKTHEGRTEKRPKVCLGLGTILHPNGRFVRLHNLLRSDAIEDCTGQWG